jgi:hypothetical protein
MGGLVPGDDLRGLLLCVHRHASQAHSPAAVVQPGSATTPSRGDDRRRVVEHLVPTLQVGAPPRRRWASALDGVCLPAESSFRWKMVLVGLSLGGSSAVAAPALVGPMLRRLLTWRGARMVLVLPGGAQGGGTRRPGRRCCRGLRRLPSRGAGPWGLRSVNDLRAALRSGGGGAGRCSRLRHFKSRFEWGVGVVTGGGPLAGWLAAAAASVASAAAAAAVTRQRRPAVSAPRAHDVGKFCSRQASQT